MMFLILKTWTKYKKTLDNLRKNINKFPKVIQEILNNKFLPYGKNLTKFIDDFKIESTSNKIERIFKDLSPKHIKNKFKTIRGFLSRFNLRLKGWDSHNTIY